MNGFEQMVTLSDKLDKVVCDDIRTVNILKDYFEKRQAMESSCASEMSNYLRERDNSNFSSDGLLCDEISAAFGHHQAIAAEIEQRLLPPIAHFLGFLVREQKRIAKDISDYTNIVRVVEKKVIVAQSRKEQAQIEALRFGNATNARSQRNVKNTEKELADVQCEREKMLKEFKETKFPELLDSVTQIDFGVRSTIKNSMMNLTHFEIGSHHRVVDTLDAVRSSADRYDPGLETQLLAKSFAGSSGRTFAVVRCSFPGSVPGDLPIVRGQVIEVIRQHTSGWWEGDSDGVCGTFPMNFVEILSDEDGGALSIDETFEIDGKYTSRNSDEISLDYGDIVYVSKVLNGWCEGHKIGSGEHGKFPMSIVRHVKRLRQWQAPT